MDRGAPAIGSGPPSEATVRSAEEAVAAASLRELIAQVTALGVDVETISGRFAQAHDLHPTDVRALRVLADATTAVTAGELGDRLGLTSGATTRVLDRLAAAGFLTRSRNGQDRRVVHVQMTARAWAAVEAFSAHLGPVVDRSLGGAFTADELAVVARFLTAAAEAVRAAARVPLADRPHQR